jgi:hypothetical protein
MGYYQIAIRCVLHIVREELFLGTPFVTSASSFCATSGICCICFRTNLHVLWSLSLAWRQLVPQLHWTTRGFHEPTLPAASCCWRHAFVTAIETHWISAASIRTLSSLLSENSSTIFPTANLVQLLYKYYIFLSGNATTVIPRRILSLFSMNEIFHNFCWIFRNHVTITHCSVWWRGLNLNTLCSYAGRLRSGDTGPH